MKKPVVKPLDIAEVKKSDNNFGKKTKSMFASLFRSKEEPEVEIKEEDVE
jgi:hypothetical protein